jgi:hypothetical protein
MLSFRMFEDAGFHEKLRAIPEDDQGIDMDYFRREIKKSEEKAIADGNNEPVSIGENIQVDLRAHLRSRNISRPWSYLNTNAGIRSSKIRVRDHGVRSTSTSYTQCQRSRILASRQ